MITSELLEAYLACPMKCYLQSNGEKCSENRFAALYQTQMDSYRHQKIGNKAFSGVCPRSNRAAGLKEGAMAARARSGLRHG